MSGKGHLLTRGPGAYKIPGFGNVPQEFNVTLLKDAPNVKAVYSSKASVSSHDVIDVRNILSSSLRTVTCKKC